MSATSLADYKQLVADAQAEAAFKTWQKQNLKEFQSWQAFNAAIMLDIYGGTVAPFSPMNTAYAHRLFDSAKLYLDTLPTAPAPPPPPPTQPPGQLWTPRSHLNKRVAASPQLDGNSGPMISTLAAASPAGVWPNGQQYKGAGAPTVYDSKDATTSITIQLDYARPSNGQSSVTIPWNPRWVAGPTGDDQITVTDFGGTGHGWEFQAFDLANKKAHSVSEYNVKTDEGACGIDRAGILPLLAGLVTPADIAAGVILHGLRFAIDTACPGSWGVGKGFVWPATWSDGGTGSNGIPSGKQLWLPRSVNLGSFGLDKYQTMIAVAAQEFGAWVSDSGGGTSMSFQSVADGVTAYPTQINGLPQQLLAKFVVLADYPKP